MRNTDNYSERMKYAALVKNSSGLSADQVEEAEFYEASAMIKDGDAKEGIRNLAQARIKSEKPFGCKGRRDIRATLFRHRQYF